MARRPARGGGVFLHDAVGTFIDCTLSGNRAGVRGGGLGLDDASATLSNCTVSGNSATVLRRRHLGCFTANAARRSPVTNSTIAENSGSDGAGMRVKRLPRSDAIDMTLRNSIVAGNTGPNLAASRRRAAATITSLGYNLSDNAGAVLDRQDRPINNDPLLGTLQDNGGPTLTHALLPGSPAIDKGASSGSVHRSARHAASARRPGARATPIGGDGADIGAFEAVPPPPPTVTVTPTITRTPTATRTATVTRTATATATATLPPGANTSTATATGTVTSTVATATRTATSTVATATQTRTGTQPSATAHRHRDADATGTQPTATATAAASATGSPRWVRRRIRRHRP